LSACWWSLVGLPLARAASSHHHAHTYGVKIQPWRLQGSSSKIVQTPRDGIVTHPPHRAEGVESTSGHDTATEGTRAAARWVAWARRGEGAGGGRYRLPDVHRGGHWCDDGGQRAVPRPQGAGPSVCQSLTLCSGGFRDGMWPLSVSGALLLHRKVKGVLSLRKRSSLGQDLKQGGCGSVVFRVRVLCSVRALGAVLHSPPPGDTDGAIL
jgi:hypothetical protein